MAIKVNYTADGKAIITKELQRAVKLFTEISGVDKAKEFFKIDNNLLGQILVKRFPRRSRTIISNRDIKTARQTINKVRNINRSLGLNTVRGNRVARNASSSSRRNININIVNN